MSNDEENKFTAALRSRPRAPNTRQTQEAGSRRVHIGAYFRPEVSRQLKVIGAEEGVTLRALMGEALDLLFANRGKPTIAQDPPTK